MTRAGETTRLVLACATCKRRGWIPGPTEWAVRCPDCRGRGQINTLSGLARRLGVPRTTLWRITQCTGSKSGLKVLDRLIAIYPEAVAGERRALVRGESS